jgi:ParG protein
MAKKTTKKGNVPEGDVRLAVNMDKKLHKKLKLASVMRETTIGDLLEELVKKHL